MIALVLVVPRLLRALALRALLALETRLLQPDGPVERLELGLARAAGHAATQSRRLRHVPRAAHATVHAAARRRYTRTHPTAVSASVAEHLSLSDHLALAISNAVGTMWCAFLFLLLALVSLPAALATHDAVVIVGWIAQTCLQLVLLAVIQAGQNQQGRHAELREEAAFQLNQQTAADVQALAAQVAALHEQVVAKAQARDAKRAAAGALAPVSTTATTATTAKGA